MAQQVLVLGTTPVLLIQPDAAEAYPPFTCQRMLVALDGNPDHERSLVIAIAMAQACGAEMHVITVIPTRQTLPFEQAATAMLLPMDAF